MPSSYVQVPPNDLGLKVATSEVTVGLNTVERQEMVIADGTTGTEKAPVTTANGLLVDVSRVAGNVAVTNANLDVALSTRLKSADTLTGLTTLGTITNVVHVDDNTGSLTIDTPNLDVALSTRLKPADILTGITTLGTITNVVHVDDNAGSLTIDATSLPLPTGAATSSNQTTEIASLASIDGKITTCNTGAVVVSSSALPSNAAQESSGNLATLVSLQQSANLLLQKQLYSQAAILQGTGFIPTFEIPAFLGGF